MAEVKNRSEILFLYDVTDANPNGDPVDENKPRIDEETGINIVTDVRLKRTIRDYLYDFKNQEIFIREIEYEPGKIQDAKLRAEDFLLNNDGKKLSKEDIKTQVVHKGKEPKDSNFMQKMKEIIDERIKQDCIDIRLFGVTLPIEWSEKAKSSITYTGPVQFKMGRSLHKVDLTYIKGTGAFASKKEAEQKTFREEYILPYSLIAFYGIVNENAGQHTFLTEADISLLLEGIWNGTKNLITRSKMAQLPRLLLQVVWEEDNFHLGELDKRIRFNTKKNDEEIRDISEGNIEIEDLVDSLNQYKEKIKEINFKVDERAPLTLRGKSIELRDALADFNLSELIF